MTATASRTWGTPETLDRSVPRPSADENCAYVRARMARDGLIVTAEPLSLTEAIAWLRARYRAPQEVYEVLSLMMCRTRPTEAYLEPGWRLVRLRRGGLFILLQTGRA